MVDNTDLAAVREYFRENKSRLIERFGATGAGIGREAGGESPGPYSIILYFSHPPDKVFEPMEIEGIKVRFEVTGQMTKLHLS